MSNYVFEPAAPAVIPIFGSDQLFPVNRIFCVGRNYEAHAAEMGAVVDREAPFYFTKSPSAIVMAEGEIAYAPRTENYHYEMELVFALNSGGTDIAETDALSHIFGCAAGIDMTRRDHQNKAKENRRPWDTSKDVEQSAVVTPLRLMSDVPSVGTGRIHLEQNGETKQVRTCRRWCGRCRKSSPTFRACTRFARVTLSSWEHLLGSAQCSAAMC